jgi:hypothetical protein
MSLPNMGFGICFWEVWGGSAWVFLTRRKTLPRNQGSQCLKCPSHNDSMKIAYAQVLTDDQNPAMQIIP